MRVLITGSSGRIGSAISKELQKSFEIIGIDVRSGRFTSIEGDITKKNLVNSLVKQVDAVVHTAAYHAPHVGQVPEDEFRRVNISATEILLNAAIAARVKRFVFTSTTSVYGDALIPDGSAVWVTENLEPIPRDIYDKTKLAAESLCRQASEKGLESIVLRMSRCFPDISP